jgi:arylsulfate sulfotransferase
LIRWDKIFTQTMKQLTLYCLVAFSVLSLCCPGCSSDSNRNTPIPAQQSVAGLQQAKLLGSPPTISESPNPLAPLMAVVEVSATTPVVVALEVNDGEREWVWRPKMLPARHQKVVLLGMHPDQTHQIVVRVEDSANQRFDRSEPLEFITPPLPKYFPPLETTISKPEQMEPGYTLFPVNVWDNNVDRMDYGYMIMLDAAGRVVWYLDTGHRTASIEVMENGHLLYNHARYRRMIEVSLAGEIIRQWHAANIGASPNKDSIPVDCDTLHHEILPLEDDRFMALSTRMRRLKDYYPEPANLRKRAEADVVGDEIVEFGADGKVTSKLNLFDHLDTTRLSNGAFGNFWNNKYEETGVKNTEDWSHANAIVRTAEKDWIILSLRHQDCLIKMNFATGEIRWILGDPSGWESPWKEKLLTKVGDWTWPYHQHGPQLTSRGTLLMYDNGNFRSIPPAEKTLAKDNFSRVLELEIDEEAMTVKNVWEYRGGEKDHASFYTPFYGEADELPITGNILITDGGHIELKGGIPSDKIPSDYQWARVFEITHGKTPELVWEVKVASPPAKNVGWSIYRSERISSLLPFAESLMRE